VPLIGQIAGGAGIDAVQQRQETFVLSRRLVGRGTLFMLRVKGDSMTGAAINDGDLVIIRRQQTAENGEIVAAQLDRGGTAEATVKTLRRVNGHVWLLPHNPAYRRGGSVADADGVTYGHHLSLCSCSSSAICTQPSRT
jgi:repressor LexA